MSASISSKKSNVGMAFLKRAAGIVTNATGEYFTEAMPVTSSTIFEAKSTINEVTSKLSNTTQSVFPKLKQLKSQTSFRSIGTWFLHKEDEFDIEGGFDASLTFDGEVDSAEIAESSITEFDRSASKISKSVVQSSHQMVEAQIASTANIVSSMDKQTAVISAGFDKTTAVLNKILEVMTKNTATLIDVTVASNAAQNAKDKMLGSGKFNMSDYKKIIGQNFQNSELGMLSIIPSMMNGGMWKQFATPEAILGGLIKGGINKAAPNLKQNMKVLDESINNVIMTSLIRLGESRKFGPGGTMAKLFGINADRRNVDTSRSTLNLKPVPYDTISREALTNALPGYMRQILIQLGGPDMVYDYRSRSFKTKAAVRKDFGNAVTATGTLYGATDKVRSGMAKRGNQVDMQMLYDLMMSDLGSNYSGGDHRKQIDKLATRGGAAEYVARLTSGIGVSKKSQQAFVDNITELLADKLRRIEIGNQASMTEVNRRTAGQNYARNADAYNVDLSEFRDSPELNRRVIAEKYGKGYKGQGSASVHEGGSVSALQGRGGISYTNRALYEIYRRLDEGINVFQVGRSKKQSDTPYTKMNQLKPPVNYNPKPTPKSQVQSGGADIVGLTNGKYSEGPNLLQNQENDDGTVEQLTKGQRFSRWGKKRGKDLAGAIFSGNAEDVRSAFGAIVTDVGQVASGEMKKGLQKVNDSFGNVTGWLKHKMFGTGYTFTDTDGKTKHIADNKGEDGGGLFGVVQRHVTSMFKGIGEKGKNWFSDVSSYFDYGDSYAKDDDEPDDPAIVKKRKRLIASSVGAFAGAGLLGGPMGLLVGALGANALGALGVDKKIKKFLFGHDKSGKPTGLVNKAADVIISPIQYQVGKTVAFAGSMLKKNVFGPLSDLGMSVKDRIHNHVASIFDEIKEKATAPFKKLGSLMMKGIAKAGVGLATIGHRVSTTLTGKAARFGIGTGTGAFGFMTNFTANRISTNSFHKLKSNEVYPLLVGQHYYDPSGDKGGKKDRSNIHVLTDDTPGVEDLREYNFKKRGIMLDGSEKNCWMPRTKDYLKWRRKQRNSDIDKEMEASGYRKKGGVGGFFGGDYKAWHQAKWGARKDFRDKARAAMSEREMTAEEVAAQIAAEEEKNREIQKNIEKNTARLTEAALDEHCIYTHDQGIRDKLDNIIDLMMNRGGKPRSKKSQVGAVALGDSGTESIVDAIKGSSANNERDNFSSGAMAAASAMAISGESVTKQEESASAAIFDEAAKDHSNKKTITTKLKELMGLQRKRTEESSDESKPKQSIFSKILGTLSGGLGKITSKLGVIGTAIGGLLAIDEVKSLWNDVIKGDMNFAEWWGEESKIGKAINGLMKVSSFVGSVGGPIVNTVSSGIEKLTSMIPFMPTISPPQIDTDGPFAGLATGILGGMYLKGATAIGSVASAAASMLNAGSNAVSNLGGGGGWKSKLLKTAAVGLAGYSYLKGPEYHDETDASGEKVVDEDTTRGMRMPGTRVVINSGIKALANRASTVVGSTKNVAAEAAAKVVTNSADDVAKSKGAMKFVKKAIEGIKNFLMKNKTFSKFATSIATKLDDVLIAIGKGADSIIAKMPQKIANIITKGGTKEAAGVATAGIGYAVMAFGGALSGGLSAANIFGVRESDVNGTMRTVASVVVAMLNAVPGLWALELADLFIAPMTIRGIICSLLYGLLGGEDDLTEKRETFNQDVAAYNEKYGADISADTYNDMTNKTIWGKMFGHGGVKTDENGRAMFDEAGHELRTNHGVAGWFTGSEKEYAHDSTGAVLRDADGNAVQAVDAYGRGIKKDAKWGDWIGNKASDAWRFITGGTKYKTDENGRAIRDENGELVVDSKEKSIIGKAGDAWNAGTKWVGDKAKAAGAAISEGASNLWEGAKSLGKGAADWFNSINPFAKKEDKEKLEEEVAEEEEKKTGGDKKKTRRSGSGTSKLGAVLSASLKTTATGITSFLTNPIKAVKDGIDKLEKNGTELDENGEPLKDETGKVVKKKGLSGLISGAIGSIKKAATDVVGQITSTISGEEKEQNETDAEGKPINVGIDTTGKVVNGASGNIKKGNIGAVFTAGLGKIRSLIMDPLKEMTDGANKFEKQQAPWKKDGAKSLGEWVSKRVGSFWNWFTGSVDEATGNSSASTGNRLATNAGNATSRLLSNMFPTSRNRVTSGIGGPIALNDMLDPIYGTGKTTGATQATGGNPLNKPFTVTSPFGYRSLGGGEFHNGIDIVPSDSSGKAEVGARFSGTVVRASDSIREKGSLYYSGPSQGNEFVYKTDDGYTIKNYHLEPGSIPSKFKTPGARVNIGDKIANMGHTGRSTGAHLHYEIVDPQGNRINPYDNISNGTQLTSFNGTSDGNAGMYDTSSVINEGKTTGGTLAALLDAFKKVGSKFLQWITGGLVGADESSSESGASLSGDLSGAMSLSGAKVTNVDDFLKLCAAEIGTTENPPGSNRVKYNDWYWGNGTSGPDYPWCMAFVQWCFHQAGLDLECKTAGCGVLLRHYQNNHPNLVFSAGTGMPKPGDIAIFGNHDHTGIIEKANSATAITTIEGNTSGSGSQDNGGCVMRKSRTTGGTGSGKFTYYIRAVDFEGLSAGAALGSTSIGAGAEGIWRYLKNAGYSDAGAAGIMGNLEAESGLKPNNLQNSYESKFGMNDDQYTAAVDRGTYSGDKFIHDSGGYGLAQWTYWNRKKNLYDAAKKANKSIGDPGVQMAVLTSELSDYGLANRLKSSTTVKGASNIVLHEFERPANQSTATENRRASLGQKYFDQFRGTASGVGGPVEDSTMSPNDRKIAMAEQLAAKLGKMNFATRKGGIGGPVELGPTSGGSSYVYRARTLAPRQGASQSGGIMGSMTNLDPVIGIMRQMLTALEAIRASGETSSGLLGELNGKEFVDQNLRDTLNAMGKVSKKGMQRHASSGSASTALTMARP